MLSSREANRSPGARRARRIALVVLFLVATGQYGWNAYGVPPLSGYDAGGHAGYILTIVEEGRLPHPTDPAQGWSTFHPPLYYLLGSLLWPVLDPAGPRILGMGLRGIGAAACLAAGLAAYRLVGQTGGPWSAAWVATALVLFVPCIQMAGVSIGNEALAYGFGALCLLPLLRLQRDPQDARAAMVTGLLAGLAVATKFTAAFVLAACAVPFLRRDLDRRILRSIALLALAVGLVAGPVYVRNVIVAGTPFPMLRDRGPMKRTEALNVLRPRTVTDYLWVDPRALLRPSLRHVAEPRTPQSRNMAMANVWGLTYATIWYDAFGHRIPPAFHRDRVVAGPLLTLLGVVPTALMLLGFWLALVDVVRTRGRADEAPLVAVWLVGVIAFVSFTAVAPSADAVKGSYMLPLAVPGAVFFARAIRWIRPRLRAGALGISTAAALAAAIIFTHRLVIPPLPEQQMVNLWRLIAFTMPEAHVGDAANRLGGFTGPRGAPATPAGD
jgi:4-amino-4-deoxy-L-arabinose transferase-like glycosyltransferase